MEERIKEIAIRISNSLFEIGDISCEDRECALLKTTELWERTYI